MAIDFKLPNLGENIDAGEIVSVLVSEGEEIVVNQPVVEIETGKATVELPCPHAGRITKVHVAQGQSVPVGGLLVSIETQAAAGRPTAKAPEAPEAQRLPAPKPAARPAAQPASIAEPKAPPEPAPVEAVSPARTNGDPLRTPPAPTPFGEITVTAPAGPATRRLARELGIDLGRVSGTGPGGRITEEDVKKAVRQSASAVVSAGRRSALLPGAVAGEDTWGPVQIQKLSQIRKAIAAHMARSAAVIPHVTNFDDADIMELEQIRKGSMADYVGAEVKLTMLSFVIKAVALSLKSHPVINASLDLEAGQVVYKDYVNLGVAVDTERGLVVPVMRGADRLSIPQIAQLVSEIAAKARSNQFTLEDLRGGTFTISNLGAIGGTYSTPIINHPEVAILLVGRARRLPVVVEDQVQIRLVLPLSLSYDHRLVDGAAAGRFLNEVKNYLQVPGRLLLAP